MVVVVVVAVVVVVIVAAASRNSSSMQEHVGKGVCTGSSEYVGRIVGLARGFFRAQVGIRMIAGQCVGRKCLLIWLLFALISQNRPSPSCVFQSALVGDVCGCDL